MLEHQKEKTDLVVKLNGSRGAEPCQVMVKLLNFLLEETREDNDIAQGNEILMNQGKITAYKTLLNAITVGYPSLKQKTG
jgi:hypothetical protein